MQCALGYAWGRADAGNVPTFEPAGTTGSYAFALAYAQGWDEFNAERRGMMTSVRSAYERWQATRGATIFGEHDRPAKPAADAILPLLHTNPWDAGQVTS
jgi:hypothetical protein